jgi:hypothetical protein
MKISAKKYIDAYEGYWETCDIKEIDLIDYAIYVNDEEVFVGEFIESILSKNKWKKEYPEEEGMYWVWGEKYSGKPMMISLHNRVVSNNNIYAGGNPNPNNIKEIVTLCYNTGDFYCHQVNKHSIGLDGPQITKEWEEMFGNLWFQKIDVPSPPELEK